MTTRGALLCALLPLLSLAALPAQKKAAKPPRRDAKRGDFLRFPLGPIGGQAEVLADRAAIEVLSLMPGQPGAAAGLRKGDRIVAVAGQTLPKHTRDFNALNGPMPVLGAAIEAAEADKGQLTLSVRRGGDEQPVDVTVTLPKLGTLARTYPSHCKKSLAFYDGVCRDLLKTRRKDGAWRSNTGEDATRYVTALCGLALLGRGNKEFRPALDKVAKFLAGPERRGYVSADLQKPAGLSNWFITMSGIYLAEHVLATGDKQYVPTIQHLCDCLAARQTKDGKYGHSTTVGYGGKGLNIINTHAHLLWALGKRAGAKIDEQAWQRSFLDIEKSTGKNGGVRYWTLQTGYWDSCARTGQMALALALTNRALELRKRMGGYLEAHRFRMREAHAMGSLGMIFGTTALRRVNRKGWRAQMDTWRWYLTLMRQPDGSAGYIGGKRNNGGDHYLRPAHVANAIAGVMLASGLGHLHICGNDRKRWLK